MATSHGILMSGFDSSAGDLRIWIGTNLDCTNGVTSFFPTTTGAAGGQPLFSQILTIFVSAQRNTATFSDAPMAAIKSVAADFSQVNVNVMVGTVLGILGATVLPAPDGTRAYCLVMGI